MQYTSDEFVTGPFTNLFYILGRLETGSLGQKALIGCEVMLEIALKEMERFGFRLSASNARSIIDILKNRHYSTNLHDHILMLRNALHAELEATVFLPIDPSNARFYREPRRDWEEAIERFPEAISDIEEASKCYALGRYAASVYHSMQIIEIGLLALGRYINVRAPRSGFTAVANELERLLNKKFSDLTDFERNNRPFLEQINGLVQSVKDAWRNKISHAEGRVILLTTDFSPQIAMEILIATRAFLRRLATELPS